MRWFFAKEELLGFLCNLANSFYNYHASHFTWPNWESRFRAVDCFFGWMGGNARQNWDCSIRSEHTLGQSSRHVPRFVPRSLSSTTGRQVFLLVWSIIPFLYVSYYVCMYLAAQKSPGVKIQRALLIFSMIHFLFFTDGVSYTYGRGYRTPTAEFFYWCVRWAWRVAVLMPIYQNCTSRYWKFHGHARFPWLGRVLHTWGLGFFVFQVVASDAPRFVNFMTGGDATYRLYDMAGINAPGPRSFKIFSYHGALVLMWLLYLTILVCGFATCSVSLVHGPSSPRPHKQKSGRNDDDDDSLCQDDDDLMALM